MSLSVAIVGASGYTGAELLRLLYLHPEVEITSVSAGKAAGQSLVDIFPQFRGTLELELESFDADRTAAAAKVVFAALPHGQSAQVVAAMRQRGCAVIDLSADYRLRDAQTYARWYSAEGHPHPELLGEAVYGLPELHREAIRSAKLVAAPGCYPTSALLAVAPLLRAGLIEPTPLIIDSKSGASGAGRSPGPATHFPEMAEGLRPYKVAGDHRHTPEIEQELSAVAGRSVTVSFTPHLVPMVRGILTCVYATPRAGTRASDLLDALVEGYRNEPFVSVLHDSLPDTASVRGSNRAQVTVRYDERAQRVLAISAIDNLVKGSSGQAIQCLNLMHGFPETRGLEQIALFP